MAKIIYTKTDEAPALATYSFLPIVTAFAKRANVDLETRDISLSSRILAAFNDQLSSEQRVNDALEELGKLAKRQEANIIKLPNISASIPQLKAAIAEMQAAGYALPDYPEEASNDDEHDAKRRYDRVKGSAVNPVLREGNSDRRAPKAVKAYAQKHPHSMGAWTSASKSHVAHMDGGDFYSSEKSHTIVEATDVRIVYKGFDGTTLEMKSAFPLQTGEIIDAAVMSMERLKAFARTQMADAKAKNVLFSLHLKATMMKVSDPILFGVFVEAFFAPVFEEFKSELEAIGTDSRNGWGDVVKKMDGLPPEMQAKLNDAIDASYAAGPDLAMVDSDRGITNLHVPSDIIIDASMPAMIRNSGQMWDKSGQTRDTKAVIPDRSYAGVYQATIDFCKANGALDPQTMGSVSNIGLMAQKAEEYGSHDKTFEFPGDGSIIVETESGKVLIEQNGKAGDIFRMCQVKDAPIQDWVKLGVKRARSTGNPAVFWLDEDRAHDAELIKKVDSYLPNHDTAGLTIKILAPINATTYSLERIAKGQDTISVTGNVLRDYLTDLFPILEVGTSAKMLSIVPLMNGGGLFETGAGGSAPKHVKQLQDQNYLRWDSLGEFLALAVSLDHYADQTGNEEARVLSKSLDDATSRFLDEDKSPTRRLGGIDNRGSHFYLAMFWAEALASQKESAALRDSFSTLARSMREAETTILEEMIAVQGSAADTGGYYRMDDAKASAIMRPSATLNSLID
ncbi:MAG: isocitrate dehydrogenase (NADP(+)) [Crocinitomicaceae bacterium]|nr:isocitrate dehydrogenase (NADP(+)) [Crocinitomicaceae bacterium]